MPWWSAVFILFIGFVAGWGAAMGSMYFEFRRWMRREQDRM